MSRALALARARFEATPRKLEDDELIRISRGDRGCLGDVLSGVGAVFLVAAVILGAMEKIAFTWTYVGVAIWVGGFIWGTIVQSRSGTERKQALESGPLVMAVVLREDEWLRRPGKRVGRAVVLVCLDEARRFDRAWLERAAADIDERLDAEAGGADWVPLRALLADRDAFGVHAVPADLSADLDATSLHLAAVMVHPERLEGGYLGGDDDREAGDLDLDIDAPKRPPTMLVIVEPGVAFVEQVPRTTETVAKSEAESEAD